MTDGPGTAHASHHPRRRSSLELLGKADPIFNKALRKIKKQDITHHWFRSTGLYRLYTRFLGTRDKSTDQGKRHSPKRNSPARSSKDLPGPSREQKRHSGEQKRHSGERRRHSGERRRHSRQQVETRGAQNRNNISPTSSPVTKLDKQTQHNNQHHQHQQEQQEQHYAADSTTATTTSPSTAKNDKKNKWKQKSTACVEERHVEPTDGNYAQERCGACSHRTANTNGNILAQPESFNRMAFAHEQDFPDKASRTRERKQSSSSSSSIETLEMNVSPVDTIRFEWNRHNVAKTDRMLNKYNMQVLQSIEDDINEGSSVDARKSIVRFSRDIVVGPSTASKEPIQRWYQGICCCCCGRRKKDSHKSSIPRGSHRTSSSLRGK